MHGKILSKWEKCEDRIDKSNKKDGEKKENLLQEAVDYCDRGIGYCDAILNNIASKPEKKRKEPWRVELKGLCEKYKTNFSNRKNFVQNTLNTVPFEKAKGFYEESMKKADFAKKKSRNCPRRLDNSEEVVSKLNEIAKLYEEAGSAVAETLNLTSSFLNETDKDILKQDIKNYQKEASQYKQDAHAWPAVVMQQKTVLKEQLILLKEESRLLEEHSLYEMQQQIVSILEQLIENGEGEHLEELNELKKTLAFQEEIGDDSVEETIPSLSPAELKVREEQRRESFFHSEVVLNPKIFLHTLLTNKIRPFVTPLEGQLSKNGGDFSLYADQFYSFLVQNDKPVSHIFIQVHEEGKVIYEEKIPFPLRNTKAWHKYLTTDGMLLIPETKLKTDFGLYLHIKFIPDFSSCCSFIISQKGVNNRYQFSVSLNETEPLYKCHFMEQLPWQLKMLSKPALPSHDKPMGKSFSKVVSFYTGQSEGSVTVESTDFPILDKFANELHHDPLLLASYVYNEIALVDPFLKQENGVFCAPGIHRNASMTFLEKQGSPWEQCQLLVYLLQKAGYQAAYATGSTCFLPKTCFEKLFLTELPGEQKEVLVQYPWVVFFDGTDWISLFPWMKEIQIYKGYDLYQLMPEEYASCDRWVLRYLKGDERILKHIGSDGNDTAGLLFIRFVEEELRKQGLSLADVGVCHTQIKKQFTSWESFPRPSIRGEPRILTDLSKEEDLYAYVNIEIYSHEHPEKKIPLRLPLYLLNGDAFNIRFSVEEETKEYLHFELENKHDHKLLLDPSDFHIDVTVNYTVPLGSHPAQETRTLSMTKGTSAALSFHFGGVNQKNTFQWYEKFSSEKNEIKRLHALLGFVGASYFEKCSQSEQRLSDLHKVTPKTSFAFGLSKLSPNQEATDKQLPQVDMVWIRSQSFDASLSHPAIDHATRQCHALINVDASSNEHQILREIFQDSYAISTAKLLELAHFEHQKKGLPDTGFLFLSRANFKMLENMPEAAKILYFPHLKNLDLRETKIAAGGQWNILKDLLNEDNWLSDWAYAYMTPGRVPSQNGEIGTLIFHPNIQYSFISHKNLLLNGGVGSSPTSPYEDPFRFNPPQFSQGTNSNSPFQVPSGSQKTNFEVPSWLSSPSSPFQEERRRNPQFIFNSSTPSSPNFSSGGMREDNISFRVPNFSSPKPASFSLGTRQEAGNTSSRFNLNSFPSSFPQSLPGIKSWSSDVRPEHKSDCSNVGDPVDVITGAFYIDEVDLFLSGAFPIEIRRNYNSQNPLLGDLGCGWKLSLNHLLVEQDNKFYAAEADGTVIVYSFNPETSRWEISSEDNPGLSNFNQKGIGSMASPFHAYIENNILYGTDGSKRFFEEGLLKKWVNSQGNTLTFFYEEGRLSRVENNNGNFYGLHYDHQNKISEIYAKDGRRVVYEYNQQGDLVNVILPNTAVISYEYDQSHRIIREAKPYGKVLENIYDEEGRVKEQKSPTGAQQEITQTAIFEYGEGKTTVTDAAGGKTTYKIFQKQIYKFTDPLGYETLHAWFIDKNSWFDPVTESICEWNRTGGAVRSLKATTDKRGLTTAYLYDSQGNPIEISLQGEDLTGNGKTAIIKKFIYNEYNLCIQEEVCEKKTTITYDLTFFYLPKRIEKYSDNTLLSTVDLEYNSLGQLEKESHSGAITFWKYDAGGFPCKKTQITGTDDPDVVTTYSYNHQGQCVEMRSADQIQESEYDILGNQITSKVFSPSGTLLSATYIGYDLNSAPIWKQTENSDNLLFLDYHASGLLKASRQTLDARGAIAYRLYEYDTRGYLIEEIDPRGYCTYLDHNALGKVIRETKAGLSTLFTYEPGGFIETITSPSGAQTIRSYTTNGLLKEEIYPDGTKSSIVYDFLGRPILETKNNISWAIKYEDATHQVIRSHLGTNTTEIQEFDERGNLIRFTDAAGYISEKTYDGLGRLKTEISPSGQQTVWSYQGDTVICILPSGEKKFERYKGGRVAESEVFDAQGNLIASSSYRYDPETETEEVIQGEEVTTTWTNALGLPVRVQKGDITTTYEYDACGNCMAAADGDGRITRQIFDGLSRITQKELPDGSLIGYTYDLDSNLTEYHLPNRSVWTASYDSMGRKFSEELQAEGQSSQRWEYTYENDYLKEAKDPMQRTHTYLYDRGGRLSQETVDGWHRMYTYDPRGLLTKAEQIRDSNSSWLSSWAYGSNGEHSLVERSYDSDGCLSSESIYLNSQLIQQTKQTWQASSRSLQVGDHTRDFIYQNNRLTQVATRDIDLAYTYDLSGSLKSKSTPLSKAINHYNASGLPENIHTRLPGGSYQESLDWYPSGKLSAYSSREQQKQFTYTERGYLQVAGEEKYDFDFGTSGIGIRTAAPGQIVPQNGLDAFGKILTEIRNESLLTTTYDPMGQVISQGQRQFAWDPWGSLLKVSDEAFTWEASYDALGRRLQTHYTHGWSSTLTTTSFYDPEEEFQEIGVKYGDKTFWKIYGPNSCDAITDEAGNSVFLIHNALGQLTGVASREGTFYSEQLPSSYGPQSPPPPIPSDLLSYAQSLNWHSMSQDPTGLIWMGARYYDPKGGRFLSPDPIGYPICLDLYTYADGDPVNYLDPDGRFASPIYQSIKATVLNTWNSPQFQGALQMGLGLGEATGAAAYTAATGGVGGLAGGGLMFFRGLDNVYTGARQIISNEWVDSGKSQVLQACGASRGFAERFDTIVGFFSPKNASRLVSLTGKSEEVALQHTHSNLRLGQQVHQSYKAAIADKVNLRKEFTLPSGRRIDFIDIPNGKVYELKPNNPRAIRDGMKQLGRYIKELNEHPTLKHIEWEGVLEVY